MPNDTNTSRDLFVRDLQTRTTERANVTDDGTEESGLSTRADAQYVFFYSSQNKLVPGFDDDQTAIYARDRETRTTSVVSDPVAAHRETAFDPVITPDARHIAFNSSSDKLVPDDTNGDQDIFVRTRD
ncbi:hypothetical protein [Streptomyces sp. 135]|uniref:hypothetical protein n=1 Tax=Streptomyces sp. 135 TaxID=2838850 RepID=UPI001CBC5B13|nr:hypothetical protein [Streptomyces sp. 135]